MPGNPKVRRLLKANEVDDLRPHSFMTENGKRYRISTMSNLKKVREEDHEWTEVQLDGQWQKITKVKMWPVVWHPWKVDEKPEVSSDDSAVQQGLSDGSEVDGPEHNVKRRRVGSKGSESSSRAEGFLVTAKSSWWKS